MNSRRYKQYDTLNSEIPELPIEAILVRLQNNVLCILNFVVSQEVNRYIIMNLFYFSLLFKVSDACSLQRKLNLW